MATCVISGCGEPSHCKGMCGRHYRADYHKAKYVKKGRFKYTTKCSVDGCEKLAASLGYCHNHYVMSRRNGEPIPRAKHIKLCSVIGCERKHYAHGLCNEHYRKVNYDKIKERGYAWARKNPDKKRAVEKRWSDKNREYVNAKESTRRAKQRGSCGTHTAREIKNLYTLQNGRCAICRTALGHKYHKDHIMPLALGGSNYIKNIQLLCQPCNQKKHAKDPVAYMQSIGFLL